MTELIRFNGVEMNHVGHMAHGLRAHPDDVRSRRTRLDHGTELAQPLERGLFDALFIADVLGVYDTYRGTKDIAVAEGGQVPATDPLLVIPAMALRTKRLGFAVSSSTTYEQPFSHTRRFSALDHLTEGRIGWNIVTFHLPNAARNFGLERMIPHDERYDRADEYLDVRYRNRR